MIQIEKLHFEYTPGVPALKDINAVFPDNASISAIIGESGSGKTTLLRCLGRFLFPQQGKILIDRNDIAAVPEKHFRRMLGIVFQDLYLFPHLTVMGNMTLALEKAAGKRKAEAEEKSRNVLRRLGIDELAKNYPVQLSGGQAQRAAIARGLVLEPEYLLLDEPTSALDINTTRDFGEWLKRLKERTKFIIVTHDIEFVKNVAADGILLQKGEIAAQGAVDDIVRTFINEHVSEAAGQEQGENAVSQLGRM
jgi:ABC-type polar amino acid transport system ATPase subunit